MQDGQGHCAKGAACFWRADVIMLNRLVNPISVDEIPLVFSDRAVAKLAVNARLPDGTDMQRLAKDIRAAAAQYARDADQPTPNKVRRELDALRRAAERREYRKLKQLLAEISDPARELLEIRLADIRDGHTRKNHRDTWFLPEPEELSDPTRRDVACDMVYSLAVTGGFRVEGRARGGSRRRHRMQVRLIAPEPSRSEPRREAERTFVMWLRIAYHRATGRMPPSTAQHYRPGPFAEW